MDQSSQTEGTSVKNVGVQATHTEDIRMLQSLNYNLQVKIHEQETEIRLLRNEVHVSKGKQLAFESLSGDLSTLRLQLDKVTMALLRKRDAYNSVKKQLAKLTASSRSGTPKRPKPASPIAEKKGLKMVRLFDDAAEFSSDDELSSVQQQGRRSVGSCGNLANEIANEEKMPSALQVCNGSKAPLRNRLLLKLHSIKSASTESLESVGRKSMREDVIKMKSSKPEASIRPERQTPKGTTTTTARPKGSLEVPVPSTTQSTVRAPPSIRPALGLNRNGSSSKVINVKMNLAAIKRSSSNCSAKSVSRPAFRM